MTAAKADYELPSPPSDGVSDLTFSPNGSLITAGSWDNGVSVCVLYCLSLRVACVPHQLLGIACKFRSRVLFSRIVFYVGNGSPGLLALNAGCVLGRSTAHSSLRFQNVA